MKHKRPAPQCVKCGKLKGYCECVDVCQRCMRPDSQCSCGETDVELLGAGDGRFELDEEVADDLRRDYADEEAKTKHYWHGYNYAKKIGKKGRVNCPYDHGVPRKDFFRGVSDARWTM